MRIRHALVLGGLALLTLAGCGGPRTDPGVATANSPGARPTGSPSDSRTELEAALDFAKCMRVNGVPDFPDPKVGQNGEVQMNTPDGGDPKTFEAAQQKCKRYLPNGGEPKKIDPAIVAQERRFSQCMRAHGVPNFPDPTDHGLQVDNDKLGVDPNGAAFKAAMQTCSKFMPAGPSGGPQTQNAGGNG